MRARFILPTLLAVLALATCAPRSRTELVVGLATDLVAPQVDDPLVSVQLTVWQPPNADSWVAQETWTLAGAGANASLPATWGLYTSDGSAPRVRIEAKGQTRNGRQVTRTHVIDLRSGETRFLRMMLLGSCLDAAVVGTCIEGQPWPVFIEVDRLPIYQEGAQRLLACRSYDPEGVETRPLDTATGLPLSLAPGDATCGTSQLCLEGTCYGSSKGTTCRDGEKNGLETDVDCGGGGDCPTCVNGADCQRGSDCRSGFCDSLKRCAQSTKCANKKKDDNETDVDCGGACDARCVFGQACAQPSDCRSSYCSPDKLCAPRPTCGDGFKDGMETDIDCGSEACLACEQGLACAVDSDCKSFSCAMGRCIPPRCDDRRRNGDESDTDCGGSCPTKCAVGRICALASDCDSRSCNAALRCDPASCADGIANGGETDVDCGGPCAPSNRCVPGRSCGVNDDCDSGVCASGRCATPRCNDHVRNGDETDVDCGGSCTPCR